MIDPNRVLTQILKEKDPQFRELHKKLEELEGQYCDTDPGPHKENMLREMRVLKERVDARISGARST